MESAASSHFALVFTMGMSAYLGLLHAWLWRRDDAAHLWVALWCFLALGYQGSRYVQLHTASPEAAVTAARTTFAIAPLLVASLVCFVRALEGRLGLRAVAALFVPALATGVVALGTAWVVPGQTAPRQDWFGHTYLGAPVRPVALALVPVIGLAIAYVVRAVGRIPALERRERLALLASLGVYAALGVASVLSALRWVPIPTSAEFGPIVVALGLNYLLVLRHRRLQSDLERMVRERTARLAESEARYRELVENAPVGVMACDTEGQLRAVNRRLLEIVGAPDDADTPTDNLLTAPGMLRSGAADVVQHSMSEGVVVASELRYTSPRWGRTVDVRLTVAPLRDGEGRVTGALGIVEDVGERKALERRLRQSQRLESVGQLAAGIAHEINNPIAYVRANLGLLRSDWESLRAALVGSDVEGGLSELVKEGEALIEESLEGVERVSGIVRDMRNFSRAADEDREPCDLDAVVESAVRMASTWRRGGTRIEEHYAGLPPVPGAEGQLRQVVLNLLVNALQAVGESGHVRVSTAREGAQAVVRVEDDGCGVAETHLERLFDPFFTTKPAGEGTGLGLYVSYEIVRSHGGEIRVASEPERGACFEVRLPLREG